MALIRLNLTKCIVIGDARRLNDGEDPVRNVKGLSKELEALDEDKYDADVICHLLYRSNKQGLKEIDDHMLCAIREILRVTEVELVKYPRI